MKNIKTKSYLLGLTTIITLGITYAYTSVSDSLNYLNGAGDTGHIGYIIKTIFDSNSKIKPEYFPDSMVVQNATTTQTGIVMLDNTIGSTLTTKAPTINILTQVWNNLNSRISSLSSSITSKLDKNTPITGATKTKITYDSKGLVISGSDLSATDIPSLDASKITSGVFNAARIPNSTYFISSAGTNGQVWKSDGSGAGYWGTDKDTIYTHPTGDGNLHVPATSTTNSGKVLTAGSTAGSLSWTTIPAAPVTSVAGKTGVVTLKSADITDATSANTANMIVKRDANGDFTGRYINSNYLNMSHLVSTRNSDTVFYSSNDNYIRKNDAVGFKKSLGLDRVDNTSDAEKPFLRNNTSNSLGGTLYLNGYGLGVSTKDNITTRLNSGFWQTATATTGEGWPQTTNNWYHLITSTHSNSNYYSMQFAGDFFNSNNVYYRATSGLGTTQWNKLWHS